MRPTIHFLVLFYLSVTAIGPARAEARRPLAEAALGWAEELKKGAVATAEKRDGKWAFAMAGQPFGGEAGKVSAERVIFEIGSISKVFTGILLAQAVREGELGLEDTLKMRLPASLQSAVIGAVTLRQLATHTSCLPRLPANMDPDSMEDPYAGYGDEALFAYLASAELAGSLPCEAAYSNLGFGLLGVVLERAYGKSWASLVGTKIADPLGMVDTVQELSKDQKVRFAAPSAGFQEARPWTFQALAGAGALRSTLADMSRFADALLAGRAGPLKEVWPLLSGDYADRAGLGSKIGLGLLHASEGDS